ncbi:hypothetical protein Bca52824_027042 [Brassica carinata]|uniref:RNase H type-1 domain-containing protein n=1 Tax=Brassica carinata TaxID=52824 RepID=A0A8X7SHR7_BRACI|nr:hypothetical protein Bca52824_027042 [Brassica carinata]
MHNTTCGVGNWKRSHTSSYCDRKRCGETKPTWQVWCIFMDNVCVTYYQVIRVERNIASPFVAEALALRWALLTAHTQEYSKICFKTDCQALLAAIS